MRNPIVTRRLPTLKRNPMVRNNNNQSAVPSRRGTQALHKHTNTRIRISKRILPVVRKSAHRNNPRLVAAQRQNNIKPPRALHPPLSVPQRRRHQCVCIRSAPAAQPTALSERLASPHILKARFMQITTHIREVNITTIHKTRLITRILQRRRQRRQLAALICHFHQRRRRHPHPSAQQRNQSAVCTEIVRIAVSEQHPILAQCHQVRPHTVVHHHIPSAAFPHNHHNVRTRGPQQRVPYPTILLEQRRNQSLGLLLRHKVKHTLQVLRLEQRMNHVERRVQRSMVAEPIPRKVSIRRICRRLRHTTPHAHKNQPRNRHKPQRRPSLPHRFHNLRRHPAQQPHRQPHQCHHNQASKYYTPPPHARKHILRIRSIHQIVSIHLRAPIVVQHRVRHENKRHNNSHNHIVRPQNPAKRKSVEKTTDNNRQNRHNHQIARRYHVQSQSVPQHPQALRKRSTLRVTRIQQHEKCFLNRKQQQEKQ